MERRITGAKGTIPNNTALAGTVTTNAQDDTVLEYSGSDDVAGLYRVGALGPDSTLWIFVDGVSPYIAKVTGIYKLAAQSYTLQLDRSFAGASADACAIVKSAIGYSYVNDGTANATVNGITVKPGDGNTYAPYDKYSNRSKLHAVSYVDASAAGADIFINEET